MAYKRVKDLMISGDEGSEVFTRTWDDNSRVKRIIIPSSVKKIDKESDLAGLYGCIVELSEELWESEAFQDQVRRSHRKHYNSTLIIFKIMEDDGGYHYSYFDYQDEFGEDIDYAQGFGDEYDEYIDEDLLRSWDTDSNAASKVMVRLCRVATPYMLSDEHKKKFVTYLKRMYMSGMKSIAEFDCPDLLNCLFQNGIVKSDKIDEIKKILMEHKAGTCLVECKEWIPATHQDYLDSEKSSSGENAPSNTTSGVAQGNASSKGVDSIDVGSRVEHPIYGCGTILSAKDLGIDILYEIRFDSGDVKRLMACYAKLKKM